jgi:signal transduction histidine kinase
LFNNLNIGQAYLEFNLDSAYRYLSQCYDATIHNPYWHPFASALLGDYLFRKGERKASFNYVRESIRMAAPNGDFITQAEAFATISGFFKKINQPDSAIYYAHGGLRASDSGAYLLGIYKNSKLLAEEYEQLNVKEALHYRKIYDSENETMYAVKKVQDLQKTLAEEQLRQQQIQKAQLEKENRLKQYGFIAGLAVMLMIAFFLYRNNRQKQIANLVLQEQKDKVEKTLQDLKSTQAQLVQSEKMASLGELTAGIAHEIQNPLNFVNNFSEVNTEMGTELQEAIKRRNWEDTEEIAQNILENEQKILHHGKRADAIVKGMLQHSQKGSGVKEPTNINALADEYFRLAYHGLKAKDKSFNATINTDFDQSIGQINIIPQDIGRVLLNLINNAFYAVDEKKKQIGDAYEPEVTVSTRLKSVSKNEPISQLANWVMISVRDNGNGVPQKVVDKIFQPFFTTKPTGQGTGLGLSLSYDIVKAHGGELKVETKDGEGSEFIISLPVN